MLSTVTLKNIRIAAIDDVATVSFAFNGSVRRGNMRSNGSEWSNIVRVLFAGETLSPILTETIHSEIVYLANESARDSDRIGECSPIEINRCTFNDDAYFRNR